MLERTAVSSFFLTWCTHAAQLPNKALLLWHVLTTLLHPFKHLHATHFLALHVLVSSPSSASKRQLAPLSSGLPRIHRC